MPRTGRRADLQTLLHAGAWSRKHHEEKEMPIQHNLRRLNCYGGCEAVGDAGAIGAACRGARNVWNVTEPLPRRGFDEPEIT